MTTDTKPNTGRLVLLLALLAAFPPLSIDMYLPAIPLLQKIWGQPFSVVNLTLVGFIASYGLCLLVYGPLSDRFGRRRPLMAGVGLYILASLLCASADNVTFLIATRMLQAAGAAAASAISLAICKDLFAGRERERILAYIGVIMALAPMLGPVLGGWVLACMSWHWIFVIQAGIGVFAFTGIWHMQETLPTPSTAKALQVAGTYLLLLRNGRYLGLTLLVSLTGAAHFSFIGGSSDIYITGMGLSEQAFGYFFALNALALMTGSLACTKLQNRIDTHALLSLAFAGIALGGMVMLTPWLPGPWRLALPMAVLSFFYGLSRPPSNNLILEQVDRHAGAASSLMVFAYFMAAAVAMWFISLDWADKISVIGMLAATISGFALAVWLLLPRGAFFPTPEPRPVNIDSE